MTGEANSGGPDKPPRDGGMVEKSKGRDKATPIRNGRTAIGRVSWRGAGIPPKSFSERARRPVSGPSAANGAAVRRCIADV